MGYTGQQTHPEVQQMMERGVKLITAAGRIARCSCPDNHTFWKRDVYAFRESEKVLCCVSLPILKGNLGPVGQPLTHRSQRQEALSARHSLPNARCVADRLQRPLLRRSRFQRRLTPGVRLPEADIFCISCMPRVRGRQGPT